MLLVGLLNFKWGIFETFFNSTLAVFFYFCLQVKRTFYYILIIFTYEELFFKHDATYWTVQSVFRKSTN